MNKRSLLLLGIIIGFAAILNVSAASNEDETQVDFVESIQPILKRSCYSCHAADKQEGGLRLDHRNSVLSGGDMTPEAAFCKLHWLLAGGRDTGAVVRDWSLNLSDERTLV